MEQIIREGLPFVCPDCNRAFPSKAGVAIHKARWCQGLTEEAVNPRSRIAQKVWFNAVKPKSLKRKWAEIEDGFNFPCHCGRKFETLRGLRIHGGKCQGEARSFNPYGAKRMRDARLALDDEKFLGMERTSQFKYLEVTFDQEGNPCLKEKIQKVRYDQVILCREAKLFRASRKDISKLTRRILWPRLMYGLPAVRVSHDTMKSLLSAVKQMEGTRLRCRWWNGVSWKKDQDLSDETSARNVGEILEAAQDFRLALAKQRLGFMGHALRHEVLSRGDLAEEFSDVWNSLPGVDWRDRGAWKKAIGNYVF